MNRPDPIPQPFVAYLQNELLRRCRANSSYSLRSFARSLEIEASALSKILHGRRALTFSMFESLSTRLGLSPRQARELAPAAKLRRRARPASLPAVSDYTEISPEMFEAISDWYHFAILELVQTRSFRPDTKWIAQRLGLRSAQVRIAVERLRAIGFLEIDAEGVWHDRSGSVTAARGRFSSAAARRLQAQILEKSALALDELPIAERDHSSICMAIDSRKLPEAKERIKRFRRELCEFLKGDAPPRDRVYHLAVSLYPVTSLKNDNELPNPNRRSKK